MLKPSESLKTETNHHMDKDPKFYFEVESSVSNAKQKTRIKSKSDARRDISESEVEYEADQGIMSYQLVRDREKRVTSLPKRYAYANLIAFALTTTHELDTDEPKTYSEAVNRND